MCLTTILTKAEPQYLGLLIFYFFYILTALLSLSNKT